MTRKDGAHNYGLSPLAGVTAGTAGVLFAFGVLCLAWRQVAGHVSLAITVLAYAVIAALAVVTAVVTAAGTWLVVLWVAHRHRHPELLVRRVTEPPPPVPELSAPPMAPAAIEPPRVYFTDDQFAAIMRHQVPGPSGDATTEGK